MGTETGTETEAGLETGVETGTGTRMEREGKGGRRIALVTATSEMKQKKTGSAIPDATSSL